MPTYQFKNKSTGEVIERSMKIAEKAEFLAQNPDLEHYHSTVTLGDPIRLGVRKPDNGFKEVIQKIHAKTPGSRLDKFANV